MVLGKDQARSARLGPDSCLFHSNYLSVQLYQRTGYRKSPASSMRYIGAAKFKPSGWRISGGSSD